ncbi:MAG: hypothetical protein Unbinned767contig1000_41 [Prokaryotic dsDNA virus sp.]|nr:MAG: hypothetical protein Unbinned767contig1000_41 [Prokaryotic dsDNA virus sp.]
MIYELRLDINPVPAARPKLARRGRVYYPKTYSDFRSQVKHLVPGACMSAGIGAPLRGPLLVSVAVAAQRPKTTKLDFPKPDVDNYAKAVLDSLNGWVWEDDQQIVGLVITKEWAEPQEDGHIEIKVKYDGLDTSWAHSLRQL